MSIASDPQRLTQQLKERAVALGFHLTGACPAIEPTGLHRLHDWIDSDYAGEMRYLAERREAYQHPDGVMPGCRFLGYQLCPFASE